MPRGKKTKEVTEFGDFQTPIALARNVCSVLNRRCIRPASIVEPTCGRGAFLQASLEVFPDVQKALGLDIDGTHLDAAKALLDIQPFANKVSLRCADFFQTDWPGVLASCPEPLLVVGNLPWVTNATLGTMGSSNLPRKTNFQGHSGLDAITGKSNFDISEWMLIKLIDSLAGRRATLAMLCKAAVARKALSHAWKQELGLSASSIYRIDADKYFGAAVDACLLVCDLAPGSHSPDCEVFEGLARAGKSASIGYRDGHVVANVDTYERLRHLRGGKNVHRWRSGIKHDCSKVMEFTQRNGAIVNGLGETVNLEPEYLFPLLKSSDVAKGATQGPKRWMLVTQKSVGEDTAHVELDAPATWEYLNRHCDRLDSRLSSIYRKRARFSVFGVGDYSFAPYKVAISGLYKKLQFALIGPYAGKPIVLDDTSYFIPCQSWEEAQCLLSLLGSDLAREFYSALIFWDSKRPITAEVLRQLDLAALARDLGTADMLEQYTGRIPAPQGTADKQRILFPA